MVCLRIFLREFDERFLFLIFLERCRIILTVTL